MSEKTVFISYRRDATGKAFARTLEQALTQRGYDVFLDVDCIDAGKWADQILTEVPRRAHFLIVLTPGCLDRCADEGDWVRREFELAVKHGRNIVPVREESVDLAQLRGTCPACMKALFDFQIARIQHSAFERDIEILVDRYIPRHKAPRGPADESADCIVSPTKLRHTADKLIGRDEALKRLDYAWADPKNHVLVIRAWGGVGKTALVAEWMAQLAKDGWRGARRVFDWSFYDKAASADLFVADALKFFGDPKPQVTSPWERGARLARLIGKTRSLVVLDGLEPLQHPPGPLEGQLKEPAVAALLRGLAQESAGLCVVTTREKVKDLEQFFGKTAEDWLLEHLSEDAGAELLGHLGVKGTLAERKAATIEVKGHALTLGLIGRYLALAHGGDIRKRDLFKFEEADAEVQGGHAFRVLAAYEQWLEEGGEAGRRQLAVLRLLGLFDRPADPGCLAALRAEPAIPRLTDGLAGLPEPQWNIAAKRLEEIGLLARMEFVPAKVRGYDKKTAQKVIAAEWNGIHLPLPEPEEFAPPQAAHGDALEAHLLVREYFGRKLRESQADAWREGHRRLFEHLKDRVPYWPEGLDGLEPLYQAVAHGCHAGRHQEACDEVYRDRILRGTGPEGNYSVKKLGSIGSNLGAVACFFADPWRRPEPSLKESARGWLLNNAAFSLRAFGRIAEALDPIRESLEMAVRGEDWGNASTGAGNLSQIELALGDVPLAVKDAEKGVAYADKSGDAPRRVINRATLADALHQAGQRQAAEARFREAERMQTEEDPTHPLLYSLRGFQFCDLLLAPAERTAWVRYGGSQFGVHEFEPMLSACHKVRQRAEETLSVVTNQHWLLDIALDHLTLGRAVLYSALLLTSSKVDAARHEAREHLQAAVDGLRSAGHQEFIIRGLLTRAWLLHLDGDPAAARADLDEAWSIAERGPMPLFQADILLTRARLFRNGAALIQARALIDRHGYHRRDEELRDAEAALARSPPESPGP